MPRVKGGTTTRKRHKKILERAKGYRGAKSKLFRRANEQLLNSLSYAYRDRRQRRRDFRRLWITRINAGARLHGMSYSRLMSGLKAAEIEIDRKVLSDMAIQDPQGFADLVEIAKNAVVTEAASS